MEVKNNHSTASLSPVSRRGKNRKTGREGKSQGTNCVLTRASCGGGAAGRLRVHNRNVEASLAEALLPCVGDTFAGWEGLSVVGNRESPHQTKDIRNLSALNIIIII